MEQALGSTDPPDKSERNSRQMCFGDKEDPMEKKKKKHCCLWSRRIGLEKRKRAVIYNILWMLACLLYIFY